MALVVFEKAVGDDTAAVAAADRMGKLVVEVEIPISHVKDEVLTTGDWGRVTLFRFRCELEPRIVEDLRMEVAVAVNGWTLES
jgi:hypothetical protein